MTYPHEHCRNCRHYKVWWRCPAEWLAMIENRSVSVLDNICLAYEPDHIVPRIKQETAQMRLFAR